MLARRAGPQHLARRLIQSALVVVLAAVGLAVPAAGAPAATYEVWSCRGPLGEPLPASAWQRSSFDEQFGGVLNEEDCWAGGSLLLGLQAGTEFPPPLRPTAIASFEPPPGTRIVGYTLWRSIAVAAAMPGSEYHYVAAVRERDGAAGFERGCASVLSPPDFNCSTSGDAGDPLAPSNRFDRPGVDVDSLQLWAGCTTSGCEEPPGPTAAELRLFRSRVQLEDPQPPAPPRLSGSLLAVAPLWGQQTLLVGGSDAGAGVAAVTLSIDGGPPQVRALSGGGACRLPYTEPRPCPRDAEVAFLVDPGQLADGPHSAAGEIVDAAGNVTEFGPLPFHVRRPPPAVPHGGGGATGGTGAPQLPTAARVKLRRSVVQHRGGRRARIAGRLFDTAGRPLAGARLGVEVRRLGRRLGRARSLRPVRTSAGGRFSLRVGGAGARWVTISAPQGPGQPPRVFAEALVRSRASLSLGRRPARLRRGQAAVFRGRLRGTGAAARGAVVEIQAIVSGKWRAVATVRSRRNGRYQWRYRFRRVNRDTIFSFRAVVHDTPGWPWPTLRSKRVKVRVDGR